MKMKKKKMMTGANMRSTFLEDYERSIFEEGKKEGKKEGRKTERRKLARKLKADKMPLEKIIQYTGLSRSVISEL